MHKNEDITTKEQDKISLPMQSKDWLQQLKDESWEAELLVSAIAIFGTFQLFGLIDWATNKFIDILPPNQYLIAYFIVFMGLLAVSILVSMFGIHFFLRAYWVGLVGLNSVFPDYSLKDSPYSEIYTEKILSILPKLKDSLQKVDQLCSVIFSAAFCILLIYAYLSISASFYLLIFNLLSDYIPEYVLLIPIAAICIIMILQMIIGIVANLKMFKQNRALQLWYFKIVKLGSIITFGPLYKSLLQITMTFGSNFKKNKAMIGLLLLFLCSGVFVAVSQIANTKIFYLVNEDYYFDDTKIYAGYYATENENQNFLLTPEIPSDIIQSHTIKVFIPIFGHEKKIQKMVCGTFEGDENKSRTAQRKQIRAQYLECYHTYNHVFLNGEKLAPNYMKYYHPRTKQYGIVCYIKLKNAIEGQNVLEVKKRFKEESVSEWAIPFYYAPKIP